MDTQRTVGVDSALGATTYFHPALSNTPVLVSAAVKGRPRVLYAIVLNNPNTTSTNVLYVQLFNAASAAAVTLGTTTPTQSFGVPPNTTLQLSFADVGLRFDAGIVVAATSAATNAVAPASPPVINLGYA